MPAVRSSAIRLTGFTLLLLVILLGGVAVVEFGPLGRVSAPSIVLVVLDTVRADHVSAMGFSARRTTPFLERLAAEGMVFPQARAAANWTLPSHASLFTGLDPAEHGCHFEHRYLVDEAQTLAEALRRLGYATAAFSGNVNVSRAFNLDQGFDHFYESWTDPEVLDGGDPSDVLLARARAWVAERPQGPAFLFINLMDAHLPYRPYRPDRPDRPDRPSRPARGAALEDRPFGSASRELDERLLAAPDLLERVVAGEMELDAGFLEALELRYDEAILGLDRRLEEFHAALERLGLLKDAVFIVTSDHGEHLGENGLVDHQGTLDEAVLRVPLLMHGAGVEKGLRIERPVLLTDLFRYVLDLAQRAFRVPGEPRDRLFLSQRMIPVDVLARLARDRPGAAAEFTSRAALRETAAVTVAGDVKLLRRHGAGELLSRLAPESLTERPRAGREGEALAASLAAFLDQELGKQAVLRERYEPEAADGARGPGALLGGEQLRRLVELGYVASVDGAAPGGGSIHAQEHLARGNRAFAAGDLVAARAEYEAAARISPGFADALFNLALAHERLEPAPPADPVRGRELWNRYLEAALRAGDQDPAALQHAYQRLEALR